MKWGARGIGDPIVYIMEPQTECHPACPVLEIFWTKMKREMGTPPVSVLERCAVIEPPCTAALVT